LILAQNQHDIVTQTNWHKDQWNKIYDPDINPT
jgi:hypothetical protein